MTIESTENPAPTPPPGIEAQRLRDLYSLKVLDNEADKRFDRYTRLATELFEVPIAVVSLVVDEHRLWFKAAEGLDQREAERNTSLCGHAVAADAPLVVEDTLRDPRFADSPLVTGEPHARFYAGVPLHSPNGKPIGTFCIIDRRPRQLSPREMRLLTELAGLVESELRQQRRVDELRLEIERNAYFDPLTSLPNRRLLTDRLEFALQLAAEQGQRIRVALLDINGFGAFNGVYGRAAGDAVLQAIANRLTHRFPQPCVVGRWRDDQFMLIEFEEAAHAPVGERVLRALSEPFEIADRWHQISAKVGVSSYPDDARDAHDLVQHASVAMRANTTAGDTSLTHYTPALENRQVRRYDLLRRLRRAIREDQLAVAFQPEMDIPTGRLIGAEALLRWTDPELGPVSAAEAAALAEQSNTIHLLGERVLRLACRQAAEWQRKGYGRLEVAVNLTAAQLHRPDLVNLVVDVLEENGLTGEQLVLEVTESSLVEEVEAVINRMQALKPLGVRFTDSVEAAKVVSSIVELAHGLELDVVAEGVESDAQLAFLRRVGCDRIQGYYYSRPLAAEEFAQFARTH
jgi:diguanylate cyclase (GGDEF)-like protein